MLMLSGKLREGGERMRRMRGILILADAFGTFIAFGLALEGRISNDQQTAALSVGTLLALNLIFLLFNRPVPGTSRVWGLVRLWFEAKERELRLRGYPKNSN